MAWLQIDQSLTTHRKVWIAAEALDIPPVHMMGHLVSLWLWSLDNAPDGYLDGIRPKIIASAAQWANDPQPFVDALILAGLIDQTDERLAIHDWAVYGGKLIEQRRASTERAKNARHATDEHVTRNVCATDEDVTRNVRVTCANVTMQSRVDKSTVHKSRVEESTKQLADKPLSSVKPKGNPDIKVILDEIAEVQGYAIANYGQEAKAAKTILQQNYSREQILECYKWLKSTSFWQGKPLSLFTVHKYLGEWVKGNIPEQEEQQRINAIYKAARNTIVKPSV